MATLPRDLVGSRTEFSQTPQTSRQLCRAYQPKPRLDFSTLSSCSSLPSKTLLSDLFFGIRAAQAGLQSGQRVPPVQARKAALYQGVHARVCQSSPVIGQSSFPLPVRNSTKKTFTVPPTKSLLSYELVQNIDLSSHITYHHYTAIQVSNSIIFAVTAAE